MDHGLALDVEPQFHNRHMAECFPSKLAYLKLTWRSHSLTHTFIHPHETHLHAHVHTRPTYMHMHVHVHTRPTYIYTHVHTRPTYMHTHVHTHAHTRPTYMHMHTQILPLASLNINQHNVRMALSAASAALGDPSAVPSMSCPGVWVWCTRCCIQDCTRV